MEEWRQIEGKGNYSVSSFGNIRNNKTGRLLKQYINGSGYYHIDLSYDKHLKVHQLVGKTFIENPENKLCIDHIDNNRLNNNLTNLRWATHNENMRNRKKSNNCSSQYKGVSFDKDKQLWRSRIMINRKNINLGIFKTQEEAGKAYNNYIIKHNLQEYFILNEFTNL
jgi:hypothetical protein